MRHSAHRSIFALALCTVLGALSVQPLQGQQNIAEEHDGALIEAVTFEGVSAVSESDLAESLFTQETRCRSLIYYPFCRLIGSSTFVERHYLDPVELERDELRVQVFYWLRGYRDARLATRVSPEGDAIGITFAIEEGLPTRVVAVDVQQAEPVLSERDIERSGLPPIGEPLNTIVLDSAQVYLRDRLWANGYADGEVAASITVAEDNEATILVEAVAGRKTTVGDLVIEGNETVSDRTVQRTLRLNEGEVLRRTELTEGQRRLVQSELFRQALVQLPEQGDTAKQIVVSLQEAPPRVVQAGVGVSTVEFAQVQARFIRLNWLGGGRRLELQGALGNLLASELRGLGVFGNAVPRGIEEVDDAFLDPTWQLSADFTQPFFLNSRNSLGLGIFTRRRSVPGIVIDRGLGANVSLTRRVADNVNVSATYQVESTRVEAGDVYYCVNFGVCRPVTIGALRGSQKMSPLALVAFADRMNDPLAPTDGFTARLSAEHASAYSGSDYRYNRVTAEATRYLEVGPGVLAGRVRGGWVRPVGSGGPSDWEATTEVVLHPRTRYYAGGARSVRGYGENQLGPRILTIDPDVLMRGEDGAGCAAGSIVDGSCDPGPVSSSEFEPRPLGGNQVFEGNIEYRMRLWGPLTGVLFLDGAVVGDRDLNIPTGGRSSVTPGFGFRYLSPVGPVRIDLGIRPTLREELPVVTTIPGEDGRPQLVQLRTTKSYDPLEDSSGFFGQVLSRLQLHLSIGEAF